MYCLHSSRSGGGCESIQLRLQIFKTFFEPIVIKLKQNLLKQAHCVTCHFQLCAQGWFALQRLAEAQNLNQMQQNVFFWSTNVLKNH